MALRLDPDNPQGPETKAKLGAADLLAALTPFQELCHVTTAEKAREHIEINMARLPDNGNQFEVDELANRGLQAWIDHPPGQRAQQNRGYGVVNTGGRLMVHSRYYIRNDERSDEKAILDAVADLFDAVLYGFAHALSTAECPMVQQGLVVMEGGPLLNVFGRGEGEAQGAYIWCSIGFDWGQSLGD